MELGQAALAEGRFDQAIDNCRRALRYAVDDPTALLSLATALLAQGELTEAARHFEAVAAKCDVQAAWLGAATAWLRLGQSSAAARAITAALSRHRWTGGGSRPLSDAVARAAGAPGWCGLDAHDGVTLEIASGTAQIAFDGRLAPLDRKVAAGVTQVAVTVAGRHLLGSPLRVADIRRVEGVVTADGGGLSGWAWHPGDGERDPVVTVRDASGTRVETTATDSALRTPRPLTRPRRFDLTAADLAGLRGPLSVLGSDERPLAGSPLLPGMEAESAAFVARGVARAWPVRGPPEPFAPLLAVPATTRGPIAAVVGEPRRPVAIVVPVYRGLATTRACLDAIFATVPAGTAIIAVDDASPEPELAALLDRLAADGRLRLLRRPVNAGFPAAVNEGLRLAMELPGGCDVVIANSDTVAAGDWLGRLRAAVHAGGDIGTATPLSNDASIVSYPVRFGGNPVPDAAALRRLARLAAGAHAATTVELPTGVGFCWYLRRECLLQTGLLREDLFAQGYGEENDFCLRARHLGWRHVAVPGAYVAHIGGQSFGAAREALSARNITILERLYPGYQAMIAEWAQRDPLADSRRRLDLARWTAEWRRAKLSGQGGGVGPVVLITHDDGGGVERCVRERCAALADTGRRAIVLRPVLDRREARRSDDDRRYLPGTCQVSIAGGTPTPNLVFRLADELADLVAMLRVARPALVEVHHTLGHAPEVLRLAGLLRVPYEVRVHDYAWFCARVSLLGAGDRYCGEPPVAVCAECVADLGARLEEDVAPADLVARSSGVLAGAARVVVPADDVARRIRRHFPAAAPVVAPHEADRYPSLEPPEAAAWRRVCVVGAIGLEKGFEVLLACARDAATRRLPLSFHVVGHTIGDERLRDTGRVEITGPFDAAEAVALIRAQRAQLGLVPSIVPETWCFALGQIWLAGLAVFAFDLGTVAERVRATRRGWLLPLGAPASRINAALLTPISLASRLDLAET